MEFNIADIVESLADAIPDRDCVVCGDQRLTYGFLSDNRLKSLSGEGYRRYSLFRPDGIVPGTQRGERFLFWPMGVADPGAMRQWGRHATAFVGQRHFDDPRLIERYFEMH